MIKGYEATIIYSLEFDFKKEEETKKGYQHCAVVDTEYGKRLAIFNTYECLNTDTIIVGYVNGKYEIIKL